MKYILLLLASSSLLANQSLIALARRSPQQDNQSQQEAERLWEQAITAKGGRGRLHAVGNMVVSTVGSYKPVKIKVKPDGDVTSHLSARSGISRMGLYVFPAKLWLWDDYRPAVFGLWVHMYNFETKVKQVITDGEPNHPSEPILDKDAYRKDDLVNAQLCYLLESRWIKPKPLKVSAEKIGSQVFDVVQTEFEGARYDFTLDRKTHLPIRFTFYTQYGGKVYTHVNTLTDYADVDGIQVPLTTRMEDGHTEKLSIMFNVEYDEDIFTKPLSIAAGPQAWMKTRSPE